ncbi:MAG: polysaccharide pyruvyl transferase family protein, partial [Eubacteriales bacterium]|nr:polysaccharide pyruvyl transferase family protein [Eubacteriales bacterium]
MNCEILTFQFAHNYGALLQCYALKKYLESKNITVSVSDFTPESVKDVYRLWPRLHIMHPRYYIGEFLRSLRRREQYDIFESFIANELSKIPSMDLDYVIIGSDQIWNEAITGRITEYYGTSYPYIKKISYAGSFGTSVLTDYQKRNVSKYFNDFAGISLRESCNVKEVQNLISKEVFCVIDPVFLIENSEWENFEKVPRYNICEDYILYYALRQDEELVRVIKEKAQNLNCKVLAIHPTCIKVNSGFIQLNNVGPREFLYLVRHAKMVGTNSFHAVSFSEIFKKKVIYKSYSDN